MYEFAGMLFLLAAAHVVCDWPLQPPYMGIAKRPGGDPSIPWPLALGAHSLIHGGAVALVTGLWPLGVLELVCHAAIDGAKHRLRFGNVVDQAAHLACKVGMAAYAVGHA